ncbi:unnamed protein product, partial [Discosporangium mesarthrocarpum]
GGWRSRAGVGSYRSGNTGAEAGAGAGACPGTGQFNLDTSLGGRMSDRKGGSLLGGNISVEKSGSAGRVSARGDREDGERGLQIRVNVGSVPSLKGSKDVRGSRNPARQVRGEVHDDSIGDSSVGKRANRGEGFGSPDKVEKVASGLSGGDVRQLGWGGVEMKKTRHLDGSDPKKDLTRVNSWTNKNTPLKTAASPQSTTSNSSLDSPLTSSLAIAWHQSRSEIMSRVAPPPGSKEGRGNGSGAGQDGEEGSLSLLSRSSGKKRRGGASGDHPRCGKRQSSVSEHLERGMGKG